jgi:hypothetical protein
MSTYKLKDSVLFKDGVMSVCPITPAFPKPFVTKLNVRGISIERFGCIINCPHFNRTAEGAELKCIPVPNIIKIESEENSTPPSNIKLN